jgi:hypothetical protein
LLLKNLREYIGSPDLISKSPKEIIALDINPKQNFKYSQINSITWLKKIQPFLKEE